MIMQDNILADSDGEGLRDRTTSMESRGSRHLILKK